MWEAFWDELEKISSSLGLADMALIGGFAGGLAGSLGGGYLTGNQATGQATVNLIRGLDNKRENQ